MRALTTRQIDDLVDSLDKVAVSIGTVRQNGKLANGVMLTQHQIDELLICQIKLFRGSARFAAQAIKLNADDIAPQLASLAEATTRIDKAIAAISTVGKLINFSTLAISVAAAVASGDILSVGSSLDRFIQEISKTKEHPA